MSDDGGRRAERNQEAFDTVVRHLLTQNKKSAIDGKCLYRGPNGLKCAIGALIPDDQYLARFDLHWYGVSDLVGEGLRCLAGIDTRLLDVLQGVHDSCDVGSWREELTRVADNYGLTMPEVDT